ncbi:galactocerebrosidase-like [Oscarella lobularis]|uniref:galactocerebrosidase-like n=1 Tax=Oscarella lobularis TaxID=121494 RepID=UPI0033137004
MSAVCFLLVTTLALVYSDYVVDDSPGLGRRFDGIGGLSAGASSPLLFNYPDKERNEILDYLFKPNFGAAFHIVKVEIGGDGQSTDGTEASHMHTQDDENYERGYEWQLMVEAKKRNPAVKLYGLPWAFPAWVGNGSGSPYKYPNLTATYIVKWIQGAKKVYNLDIDYIGIWNERNYDSNYIKVLRSMLDSEGFQNTKIVAPDGSWGIASDIMKDPELAKAVDAIGAHYPGTYSSAAALETGKPLWASEDFSTLDDLRGGGCWIRLLNRNYVNGNMTSTISWSLIASWYYGLPYQGCGLMTAYQPWSGNYVVSSTIWGSAHTCQFTSPGWSYLKHGYGVGNLDGGGTYVAFLSPNKKDLTIVIETMSYNSSLCIRRNVKPYNVSATQSGTFNLKGSLASISSLGLWMSHLDFATNKSTFFEKQADVQVKNGQFTLSLQVDSVYTLTTTTGQSKGSTTIPPMKPFPLPYSDNFDASSNQSEATYFADQTGSFQILDTGGPHGKVLRQMVRDRPITWCNDAVQPVTIIGDQSWTDINVTADILLEKEDVQSQAFVAARVGPAGCGIHSAKGVFLRVFVSGVWILTQDLAGMQIITNGSVPIGYNQWHTVSLLVKGSSATGSVDGKTVFEGKSGFSATSGWAGLGSGASVVKEHQFTPAQFDNFHVFPIA